MTRKGFNLSLELTRCRDSTIVMITRLGLATRELQFNSQQQQNGLSSPKHPDLLLDPASFLFRQYWCSLHESTVATAWSWPLVCSNNQVKNEWSYTSTPLFTFMACKDTDMPLHFESIQNTYFQNHRMVTCGNVEASTVPWTTDPSITQHSSMKRSSIMGTFGTYCW